MENHSLLLILKPGYCPSESTLAAAIGSKAMESHNSGVDGGRGYERKTFFVPQAPGIAPVQITFAVENTCRVTISHSQPL